MEPLKDKLDIPSVEEITRLIEMKMMDLEYSVCAQDEAPIFAKAIHQLITERIRELESKTNVKND